jgi:hypothetical protein
MTRHHYFGGRKEVYVELLARLGDLREERLAPPVGRSARARVADDVSRWLDWTETNRTIWLATIARGDASREATQELLASTLEHVLRTLGARPAHVSLRTEST